MYCIGAVRWLHSRAPVPGTWAGMQEKSITHTVSCFTVRVTVYVVRVVACKNIILSQELQEGCMAMI